MNDYLDRIVYAHDGSFDFRPIASSLGHGDHGWGQKFQYYGRSQFQVGRKPSTWYWADSTMAVVIRRLPGDQGDGRDDRAHALFGSPTELDLTQALALAGKCPLWTEESWYGNGAGVLRPVPTSRLPDRRPLWEPSGVDREVVNELWPIVHALDQRPDVPVWVLDNVPEERAVSHIRTAIGMAALLVPSDLPWTFTTRQDSEDKGSLHPRIRFVHGWGMSDVASDGKRTVIRYDHHNVPADEERDYRDLVRTYLSGGPQALERELNRASVPADLPAPAPVGTMPAPAYVPRTDWAPDYGIDQHLPTQQAPAPQESALSLFRELDHAHGDQVSALVRRVTQARVNEIEQASIRSDLAHPGSLARQSLDRLEPAERDRLLAQLLTMTAMRPDDWRSRQTGRSVKQLLHVIGAPAEPVHRRRRKQPRSRSDLMPLVLWLLGAAILVLALVVATNVTG